MDRAKLAHLRKKSVENKTKRHQEILDSNASVKEAVLAVHEAINNQQPFDDTKLVEQLEELKSIGNFSHEITRLENALKEASNTDKLDEVIEAIGSLNNKEVVNSVNELLVKLDANSPSQSPGDYQPVRRVIKVGDRFVFDDRQTPLAVGGSSGGGSGGSSVQQSLIENDRVKIISPGFHPEATIETFITPTVITQTDGVKTYTVTINGDNVTEEWS